MEVINRITETIIRAAMAGHQELGPGLLESTYETCLAYELAKRGLGGRTTKRVGAPRFALESRKGVHPFH
jgi:GxxExxY protein